MRKLISLVLMLMMFFSFAAAEGSIDFANMTLTELLELHALIDSEIDTRINCESSVFPAGMYIGGVSIKAGNYVIFADDKHFGADIGLFASEDIYSQAVAEGNEDLALFYAFVGVDESAFVSIEEGNVLFTNGTLNIKEASADWMP